MLNKATMKKTLWEVSQSVSGRSIVIVQADDMQQAIQRTSLVVGTLDLPFDPMAENWTIREAKSPYTAAVFADGYFQLIHEGVSELLH